MLRTFAAASILLIATAAAAQQRSIFDIDDFVDPRQHDVPVFASRLVLGGANGYVDDYRPLHRNAHFISIANSYYRGNFQFDYKHSEVRAEPPPPVQVCNCDPPVYFPTPPQLDETPAPPRPGGRDMLQLGWYAGTDVKLRYRLSVSNQSIDTDLLYANTKSVARTLHGYERSVGVEGDAHVPIIGFGTFHFARTLRSGTAEDRRQNELAYTEHFPGIAYRRILLRGTLTVGGVSGRGVGGINLVNPIFEAFWHDQTTHANFHLAWSPSSTRSGANGWETHHQIALLSDWGLVKVFRKPTPAPSSTPAAASPPPPPSP
jgi:hypothetical protein